MFKYLNKRMRKGQSTLEYAILIIIILGALLSIQVYIKRGLQGRFKQAADDIGDQYSPGNTNLTKTTTTSSWKSETYIVGEQATTLLNDEITNVDSDIQIMNVQQEYWGN